MLDMFWSHCDENRHFNIGYPAAADFDYSALQRFLDISINNCGDWTDPSNYILNSFAFEAQVMRHFADLFRIPFQESWGYVTNGGTEGNMFGCYLGRDLFPTGRLYHSQDAHYSIDKIARLLRIPATMVPCLPNGEMNIGELIARIGADGTENPIIFASIGTTMRGAVDDIAAIRRGLDDLGIARGQYYLHADAALSGMILPYVDDPQPFDFADGIDSISVSGHKMIGAPMPCGIVLAKRDNVERISAQIDYIAAHDRTITGSRNGLTPLMMWHAVRSHSHADWKARTERCLSLAQQIVDRFQAGGIDAWRNRNSVTVLFPRPSEAVWQRHRLQVSGDVAHMVVMGHLRDTARLDVAIDAVIADLRAATPGTAHRPAMLEPA